MKFVEIIKEKRNTKIKILGCTVFGKKIDKEETTIKIKMFFNIFYFKMDMFCKTYNFRFLGFSLLHTKLKDSYKIYYLLFLPIWVKNANCEFLNDFLEKINNKYNNYDEYYIFLSRSGEFYLLMHHFLEWLHNNKSSNFILIFTAKYHLNICRMFFPDIPMAYVKKINVPLVSRAINSTKLKYKNKTIYIPTNEKYFRDVENAIRKNSEAHYYSLLKEHLNLSDNISSNFSISTATMNKIKKIVKYILNDNFILLSPETLSNEPMEKDFWENLAKQLKKCGYEIYVNCMEFKNLLPNCQATFLTYEESIELSKYAKAIIGMRSGYLECLSKSEVPLFALYTDFPNRPGFKKIPSGKVLTGYSISKLPNINKELLFEYDVSKYVDEEDLITEILDKIKLSNKHNIIKGVNNGESR